MPDWQKKKKKKKFTQRYRSRQHLLFCVLLQFTVSLLHNTVQKNLDVAIEGFSFECRKVIGFAITTLRDWLKTFAPLFHAIRSKSKPIVTRSHAFSHALRKLRVITSSFDCFTVLPVFFVIG